MKMKAKMKSENEGAPDRMYVMRDRNRNATIGKPNTVLMTTDTVGGVWIYALEMARSLGERGVQVVLAAMGDRPSPVQLDAAASISTLKLESRPYKLEWMQQPWDDVRESGEWLLDLEAAYNPDIIHLNGYAHGALAWSAPVLIVGHSCVWSWFHAVRGSAPGAEWAIYRREVARGLRAADAVTAPTGAMLAELRRHYGSFRSAGVVHNARRTDALRPLPRENFVLTAGRLWDDAKNMRSLDAAARSIDWPVLAAGPTRNPDGGEIEFGKLQLLGMLSPTDLGKWMGRASIYALPARYEPFGLTVLEAAHAGCALVLGDIPTFRELWQDAAVFVPVDDPEAIARAVNGLARDPHRLELMAERAVQRAGQFTTNQMVSAYLKIYTGLCAETAVARLDREPRSAPAETIVEFAHRIAP